MTQQFFLLAFLFGIVNHSLALEIKLADASASASVVASQPGYQIRVEFRPVTTLDEISNKEMSETLAQFYAEEALSSLLHAAKAIVFSKVKSTIEGLDDSKSRCVFDIPTEAIIDAPFRNVVIREEIVGKKRDRIKVDASTRLLDFRSTCFRDLRIAEAIYAEKIASANGQEESNALKQKIRVAFSSLQEKIKGDENLFRSEKKELIEKSNKVEGYLLDEINGGVEDKCGENKMNKLPIVDAVFKEPFGGLLKADFMLLTHGGARFIEIGDGVVAILAVGFAMADNEDREDIAELKASAELGKLQAGEETIVENKIERQYRRSSNGGSADENIEIKRVSKAVLNSIDFHKTGETVGTWLSADGKRFFMAKGRIVRNHAKE